MKLGDLVPKGDVKAGTGSVNPTGDSHATSPHHHGFMNAGQTSPFLKSNLFIFLIGQVFAVVCWLIIGGVVYGRLTNDLAQLQLSFAKMDAQVQRMDREGTNASKWMLEADSKILQAYDVRIHVLEDQSRKIDVLVEKTSRIDETLRERTFDSSSKKP